MDTQTQNGTMSTIEAKALECRGHAQSIGNRLPMLQKQGTTDTIIFCLDTILELKNRIDKQDKEITFLKSKIR